ncbi:MAG: hypothetical protein EOO16_09160 [Chitinophagaceae bacterium]|nr:MAG: hypothetical protein EOO16_09160 [Chitinophagaceae bacterium]
MLVACNQTPQASTTSAPVSNPLDTAGLAAYQASKAVGAELPVAEAETPKAEAPVAKATPARVRTVTRYVDVPVKRSTPKKTPAPVEERSTEPVASNTGSSSSSGGDLGSVAGVGNDAPATTPAPAEKKKGISKTAKGAIIGGVAGAVGGAVLNKKNRGAGAIIGGVIGAAGGAVIGRSQDKKDGRWGQQ